MDYIFTHSCISCNLCYCVYCNVVLVFVNLGVKIMNKEQVKEKFLQIFSGTRGKGLYFQYNIAQNTGREFEVGYVVDMETGKQILFCKRTSYSTEDDFYLCNEFREYM